MLCAALLLAWVPAQAQVANLLTNPGFEAPFTDRGGEIQRLVAQGWEPWHRGQAAGDPSWRNRQPGYIPATADTPVRVFEGSEAQLIASEYQTHDGGVYQRITGLSSGTMLTLSMQVYVWSTAFRDSEDFSDEPGGVLVQVGIDPTGGTDADSANIIWSTPTENYDGWNLYTVSASVNGTAVTVWLRSVVSFPQAVNFVYLDAAALTAGTTQPVVSPTADLLPTATPPPTNTLVVPAGPTATDDDIGIIIPASATPTATATSTTVPTVPPTATVVPTQTSVVIVVTATPQPPTQPPPVTVVTATPEPIVVTATAQPSATSTNTATATATAIVPATATVLPSPTPEEIGTGGPIFEEFPGRIFHTVRSGDTVYDLSRLYGSSTDAIIDANGLDEEGLIFVGQQLVIPVRIPNPATVTPTPTPLVPPTAAPDNGGVGGPGVVPGVGEVIYIVQPGDTLSVISRRYNTTVATLAQVNGIVNPNIIRVGQQIRVPGAAGSTDSSGGGTGVTPQPPAQRVYVVQPGDTLYRISLALGLPLNTLIRANRIANPNLIYVGQVLVIP